MNALLVRVGADQSEGGGYFNGPVDSRTWEFAYVPIPETGDVHPGMVKPYSLVAPALKPFAVTLSARLAGDKMHLDPDFKHLTYGDRTQKANLIQNKFKLTRDDLIVFYASLRDVHPAERLVYAIIGLYVVDDIVAATKIPFSRWDENAHTRRKTIGPTDIVVRGKPGVFGRLEKCIPIGDFRVPLGEPHKQKSYRVETSVLATWGGLSVKDGYLLRGGPFKFLDAAKFYAWFLDQKPSFISANN